MVERQDPDNFTCFLTREWWALKLAAYVFNILNETSKPPVNKTYFFNIVHLLFNCKNWYFTQYYAFNVYRRELAPGTVSLTADRAQGDDSKHWAYSIFGHMYPSIEHNKVWFNKDVHLCVTIEY